MARQSQVSEFNTFVKGLYTEASPLTYPEGTAIDLDNFELNKDGSINRRLGIDLEVGGTQVSTNTSSNTFDQNATSKFIWDNVGGDASSKYLVVQVGNELLFFDATKDVASTSYVGKHVVSGGSKKLQYSFAQVDGLMVVATGSSNLLAFDTPNGSTFEPIEYRLKVRDVFGVEDTSPDGTDWRSSENVSRRQIGAANPSPAHLYNLRNMSWSPFRYSQVTLLWDAIQIFRNASKANVWPSYADNVNAALFPDANNKEDRNSDRFVASSLLASPSGNFEAPNGYFIIDLFNRGASRYEGISRLDESQGTYTYKLEEGSLPVDRTPDGVRVVASYAGRMWYSGFSGEVIGGDKHSPKLSSYVMFSRLIEDPSDLGSCHQKGDPTSKDFSELLDTDGGFIRVDGAYNIKALVPVADNLLIMAENGVWALLGGSGYGFTATDYKVVKVSSVGILGKNSWAVVDKSVLFWAKDAIYQVNPDQYGDLVSNDITTNVIGGFYNNIPSSYRESCEGIYNAYEGKVVWVYSGDGNVTHELVLDVTLGSFYKSTYNNPDGVEIIGLYEPVTFILNKETSNVVVGSNNILAAADNVVASITTSTDSNKNTKYVVVNTSGGLATVSFASKHNTQFKDWSSLEGGGLDAAAYLVTGYISGGDYQRSKQVPYVTFHFTRTEDGFEEVDGDIIPTNQSSCIVQAQWEWANSEKSGRWGRPFQAYRYKRFYMPETLFDSYDNGFSTIVTKNKIRGKGKVISFLIKTEESKDCKLLGWSMLTDISTRV